MNAENIMLDHVSWMEKQNYAPGYIDGVIKSVKAWLVYNHIEIRRKIKIKNIAITLEDEKVPDHKQLMEIFEAADLRTKVVASLMAFSGTRPQVMGKSDRSDGLVLGDIADLKVDKDKVEFTKIPAMITVRAELSKTGNKYITFLGELGCKYVLKYLKRRIAVGEILDKTSPLVTFTKGYENKGWRDENQTRFIATPALTNGVRKATRGIIKMRPYALRAYFDTQLLMAESQGCMVHAYRQFFMGHKGDIEARYTTNKGRLPEQLIEDMRSAYDQSQIFLTGNADVDDEQREEMFRRTCERLASMYGIDPSLIPNKGKKESPPGPYESRIIQEDELIEFTSQGWEIVRDLAGCRFLIRRKTGIQ